MLLSPHTAHPEVWKEKYKTAEGNCFHRKREWRVQFENDMKAHAKKYIDSCCKFIIWDGADTVISQISDFNRKLGEQLSVPRENILNIPVANLISACSVKGENLSGAASVTSWCLSENNKSVGILILPQYVYKKGNNQLWLTRSMHHP